MDAASTGTDLQTERTHIHLQMGTNGAHEGTQTLEVPATDNIPFSLHQLHAFKTVVATGSKEQTADLLGVTITNISLMLNKLEKDFDEQLLIRSKGAPMQAHTCWAAAAAVH